MRTKKAEWSRLESYQPPLGGLEADGPVAVHGGLEELAGAQVPEEHDTDAGADGEDVALEGDGADAAAVVAGGDLLDGLEGARVQQVGVGLGADGVHVGLLVRGQAHVLHVVRELLGEHLLEAERVPAVDVAVEGDDGDLLALVVVADRPDPVRRLAALLQEGPELKKKKTKTKSQLTIS